MIKGLLYTLTGIDLDEPDKPKKPYNPFYIEARLVPSVGGRSVAEYAIYRNRPVMSAPPKYLGISRSRNEAVDFLVKEYGLDEVNAEDMRRVNVKGS